jgi:hypothetical protein
MSVIALQVAATIASNAWWAVQTVKGREKTGHSF